MFRKNIYNFRQPCFTSKSEILRLMTDKTKHENIVGRGRCFFGSSYYTLMGYPENYFPDKVKVDSDELNNWINSYVIEPILRESESRSLEFAIWVYRFIFTPNEETEEIKQNAELLRQVFNTKSMNKLYNDNFEDDTLFLDLLHVMENLSQLSNNEASGRIDIFEVLALSFFHILRLVICFPIIFHLSKSDTETNLTIYANRKNIDAKDLKSVYFTEESTPLKLLLDDLLHHSNLNNCINECLRLTLQEIYQSKGFAKFEKSYLNHVKSFNSPSDKGIDAIYTSCNPSIGPGQVLADGFGARIHIKNCRHESILNVFLPRTKLLKEVFILQVRDHFLAVRPEGVLPRCSKKTGVVIGAQIFSIPNSMEEIEPPHKKSKEEFDVA
jgi:hypothetical protein